MKETEKELVVKAGLPGIDRKDIQLTSQDGGPAAVLPGDDPCRGDRKVLIRQRLLRRGKQRPGSSDMMGLEAAGHYRLAREAATLKRSDDLTVPLAVGRAAIAAHGLPQARADGEERQWVFAFHPAGMRLEIDAMRHHAARPEQALHARECGVDVIEVLHHVIAENHICRRDGRAGVFKRNWMKRHGRSGGRGVHPWEIGRIEPAIF